LSLFYKGVIETHQVFTVLLRGNDIKKG